MGCLISEAAYLSRIAPSALSTVSDAHSHDTNCFPRFTSYVALPVNLIVRASSLTFRFVRVHIPYQFTAFTAPILHNEFSHCCVNSLPAVQPECVNTASHRILPTYGKESGLDV